MEFQNELESIINTDQKQTLVSIHMDAIEAIEEELTDEELGQVLRQVVQYQKTGEVKKTQNRVVNLAFQRVLISLEVLNNKRKRAVINGSRNRKHTESIPRKVLSDNQITDNQITDNQNKEKDKKKKEAVTIPDTLNENLDKESIQTWKKYKEETKNSYKSQTGFNKTLSRLSNLIKETGYSCKEIIDHSMAQGYKGLFAPSAKKKGDHGYNNKSGKSSYKFEVKSKQPANVISNSKKYSQEECDKLFGNTKLNLEALNKDVKEGTYATS